MNKSLTLLLCFLFFGCLTPSRTVYDYGIYKQGSFSEDELVTLNFDGSLYIRELHGEDIHWGPCDPYNSNHNGFTVKVPPGEYSFPLNWEEGRNSWKNILFEIELVAGKTYKIYSERKGLVITIYATDVETKEIIHSVIREYSGYRYI